MTPYDQGHSHWYADQHTNPYDHDTAEHAEWNRGHFDAGNQNARAEELFGLN